MMTAVYFKEERAPYWIVERQRRPNFGTFVFQHCAENRRRRQAETRRLKEMWKGEEK